jgi:site-specific DNA-cytosine methylase
MRVLIACEYSGRVRNAFAAIGHDAVSADFEPAEDGSANHYRGDCFDLINGQHFDLMIAHPPCTYLSVSGMHWTTRGLRDPKLTEDALDFVRRLMAAPIDCIAIENPVSVISSRIRKPDQIIQPWMFGHGETKATCLWLKGLPKLTPTNVVEGREARVHRMPPKPDRWKERSRTYQGIAEAMAEQWGKEK